MSCRHKSLLCTFAIVGLSIFTNVGIANANPLGPFCSGQFKSNKDCENSGGVWLQGWPINPTDCSRTCEFHPYIKYTGGCVDARRYAASFCGKRHAVVAKAYPSVGGNRCGYAWFTIDCQ